MANKTDKTAFWANLGDGIVVALIILALCFGIDGCKYWCAKADALNKSVTVEQKN